MEFMTSFVPALFTVMTMIFDTCVNHPLLSFSFAIWLLRRATVVFRHL